MEPRDFLDALPIPAVFIQRNERIGATNRAARALLGEGIDGRHFITALRQPMLLDAIEATMRDAKPRTARYLGNDGRQDTAFDVTLRAVGLEGVLVAFQDVTSVEQAVQMRRDFVANVSHELKTPLTSVLGFIETLKGPARDDAGARDRFLTIMEAEAGRMNRLVSDLLSLSRVEAEERMRPTDRLDLGEKVRSVLGGLQPLAEAAAVTLARDLPEAPVEIRGDTDQLRQVLVNLVENGIKYAGRGATVTVAIEPPAHRARLRAEGVLLSVADTGPGIDPRHLPRLTERFYRVDTHRSREQGGTGLGLAIVKHIVNRHRGRMRIVSEPGQGTRFEILLPV
ncbi:ATP-binding protein [Litorisediminicola beolgyonensis]|uniref:histidine kinase n=1 Tax=Litorisediminicola beolgyonensis TaxID=1173614 RepID=A0ABW3ZID3_9RHOB